jgi:hypothetical protein
VLSPSDVSAVIVTKGDVDLTPVLESLIFDDVVVYDNSVFPDQMTFGRVLGARAARHSVIYSQDDDIMHTADAQERIIDAYQPGFMVGCMWPEWSAGAKEQGIPHGYDDLIFPGSGSISDEWLWGDAIHQYLAEWPFDDFCRLWSDTIIGVIAPTKQLDIRFEILPCAEDETRMANLPDAVALKTEAIRRARQVRDIVHA